MGGGIFLPVPPFIITEFRSEQYLRHFNCTEPNYKILLNVDKHTKGCCTTGVVLDSRSDWGFSNLGSNPRINFLLFIIEVVLFLTSLT